MFKSFLFFCLILIFTLEAKILKKFDASKENVVNANLSYSQDTATRNLYFAYGAYCNATSLSHWNCKWCAYIPGFQLTYLETKDELQVFVGYDVEEDQIVISFRGTHNIFDWLDDFDIIKVPYPGVSGGEVHQGFYTAWKELKAGVMNATTILMDKYNNTETPLLITGHSLGAAIAQLAAIDLRGYANSTGNDCEINLYTYGSPRWGNLIMANYFSYQIDENWRVVNHHDVVPTVPFEKSGYHHTWTEVWYTEYKPDLKYKICNDSGEDSSCSYIERSAEDHLWYLDIYESCP